jgi:hypothetical protein
LRACVAEFKTDCTDRVAVPEFIGTPPAAAAAVTDADAAALPRAPAVSAARVIVRLPRTVCR